MEIATQLDENHAGKLAYIQQQTNHDVAEVLHRAIDLYYQQLKPLQKSPLEVLQDAGLVGCFDDNPKLSSNYKSLVHIYLDQKYP